MGGPQIGNTQMGGPTQGDSQDASQGAEGLRALPGQQPPAAAPAAPPKKVRTAAHLKLLISLFPTFLFKYTSTTMT